MSGAFTLFDMPSGPAPLSEVNSVLAAKHYLGPAGRGWGWSDHLGVMVLATPTARRIPTDWLELSRWCLFGEANGGSRQWAIVRRWIATRFPSVTTVVSYSDPAHGHSGSLYRACGWLWAPTWHRLREPPTGNGRWSTRDQQRAKDRWVFPLLRCSDRMDVLSIKDESIVRKMPWAEYAEPRWKRGHWVPGSGGGDFKRWQRAAAEEAA